MHENDIYFQLFLLEIRYVQKGQNANFSRKFFHLNLDLKIIKRMFVQSVYRSLPRWNVCLFFHRLWRVYVLKEKHQNAIFLPDRFPEGRSSNESHKVIICMTLLTTYTFEAVVRFTCVNIHILRRSHLGTHFDNTSSL